MRRRFVERPVVARKRGARPRMTADVERVLVSLSFVLVLEAVAAETALILLLGFVSTRRMSQRQLAFTMRWME